jgi:tellurite methyltransferase
VLSRDGRRISNREITVEEWDEIWKTEEGRAWWLEPEPFVLSLLPRFKKEGVDRVLDLGFGLGRHSVVLAKQGFDVYGIEPSPAGMEYAVQWAEKEGIALQLIIGEMSALPFDSDSFDLTLAWNVIYHGLADHIRQTIGQLRKCLKPGGYLLGTLISTKNEVYGLGEELESGTFVIADHQEKSHPHHYFDREEIDECLSGFALETCEDVEQGLPGSYHWQILAKLLSKEGTSDL